MDDVFDYRRLLGCEFKVPYLMPNGFYEEVDCGEPVVAIGWWGDGKELRLCEEHLRMLVADECSRAKRVKKGEKG